MNPTLVETLVDLLAFLELSGEAVVHPDAAVAQLEAAAASLQRLSSEDRRVFAEQVADLAARETAADRRKFVASLPAALGIA